MNVLPGKREHLRALERTQEKTTMRKSEGTLERTTERTQERTFGEQSLWSAPKSPDVNVSSMLSLFFIKTFDTVPGKGLLPVPNSMNFRKTSEWGGGHFRSEKLCCAFSVKGKHYG